MLTFKVKSVSRPQILTLTEPFTTVDVIVTSEDQNQTT